MIEISRVKPKKILRKLLTKKQTEKLCRKNWNCIPNCPMTFQCGGITYSCRDVKAIEESIRNYWNEEIEVKDEIFSDSSGT